MIKPLNILFIAIMLMTGCEDEKSFPYKDLNWMIYSEEGACILNDEITDEVYVSKLAHILDGYQSYIPNNTFCYEYTGGISLHYYEDRNYMIATPPESSIALDEPLLPDTIDFSYYTIIHYEEK
jgi:hypothetical protein